MDFFINGMWLIYDLLCEVMALKYAKLAYANV